MIDILLADDQALIRKFLRGLIERQPGWSVCGEAADGEQAIEKARLTNPDLIVLDLHMPGMNGFDVTTEILATTPEAKILVVSAEESLQFGKAAEMYGARGYLDKSDAVKGLVGAITSLLRDETHFE
jgi:DNA-binding NarL/FixJ family response regulator